MSGDADTSLAASGHERVTLARLAGLLIAASSLICCTAPTPYQAYRPHSAGGIHGGYSEQRLAPDRYLVRFHGNSLTSRDRVDGYMLFRAAELTLQNGFDWFLVVDRNTEHKIKTIMRAEPVHRPWYGPGYEGWQPEWNIYAPGHGWRSWYDAELAAHQQYNVSHIEAFETAAEIKMEKAPMPIGQPSAIDARRVVTELGPRVERPEN